ncbi:MAG: YicC family protein [Muribaculaceae bacterium]|nr:YicC family protein [Muribaculaceae bacterium]
MLHSMTGFGRAEAHTADHLITIEIKTLNSKQLELSMRVPSCYRAIEGALRNMVSHSLERGKIDISICRENTSGNVAVTLSEKALEGYKKQFDTLSEKLGVNPPADFWSVVTRMPDVMENNLPSASCAAEEDECKAVENCLKEALEHVNSFRATEGAKLELFFMERIKEITDLLCQITPYEQERVPRIKQRLAEMLARIPEAEPDSNRLEQELIYYIEKLDVTEEKQRLGQHLRYFIETLELPTPGQGKKLGFISQEMGREINTLGSKSNHAEMQKIVVRMKDSLEQIKEQVLNTL